MEIDVVSLLNFTMTVIGHVLRNQFIILCVCQEKFTSVCDYSQFICSVIIRLFDKLLNERTENIEAALHAI